MVRSPAYNIFIASCNAASEVTSIAFSGKRLYRLLLTHYINHENAMASVFVLSSSPTLSRYPHPS
jgi:hypothetical protein